MTSARLGDRSLFPSLAARSYLNHGGISPASQPVQQAVHALLTDYAAHGAGAYVRWSAQREQLRAQLARLIGAAAAADVALTTNTTRGVSDVALCLRWRPGDRVVLFEGEFPSNVTPWLRAAELHGLEPRWLPLTPFAHDLDAGLARLDDELARGARLVAVSAVQFQTGLRMPLAAMAERCHRHGALLFVDAVQAVGAVPLAVARDGVDFLVAGSHKWMMGLEGCGLVYASPSAVGELLPRVAGWLSHDEATSFLFEGEGHLRYDRPIKTSVGFLEGGNLNAAGCAGLGASLSLIEQIGVENIHTHVNAYHDLLEPELVARGFGSERSAAEAARSCTLSVRPPGEAPVRAWVEALGARGVACACPDGRLRFTPHWPNALDEVPLVVAALDEARASLGV